MADYIEIDQVLDEISTDRDVGRSVLTGMTALVTGDEFTDVTFEVGQQVVLPTFRKMLAQLDSGGLLELQQEVDTSINLMSGVIQTVEALKNKYNINLSSSFWDVINLESQTNSSHPIFDAYIINNESIGFNFAAKESLPITRKFSTEGAIIGDFLLPAYTSINVPLYTSTQPSSDSVLTEQFNMNDYSSTSLKARPYFEVKTDFYGKYFSDLEKNKVADYYGDYQTYVGNKLGFTYTSNDERVWTAVKVLVKNPFTNSAANPTLFVVENTKGYPDYNKLKAVGTYQATGTDDNATWVTFNLNAPVLSEKFKSYTFIFQTDDGVDWPIWYANEKSVVTPITTKDSYFWYVDSQMDGNTPFIELVTCDFGDSFTGQTFTINPLEISGGFNACSLQHAIQIPTNSSFSLKIETSPGVWQDISSVDTLSSQPSSVGVRAIITGSRYAAPLINTRLSELIGYRPNTSFTYLSTLFDISVNEMVVSYTLRHFTQVDLGSGETHSFLPGIMVGSEIIYPDTLTKTGVSNDGLTTSYSATFDTTDVSSFMHIITGETVNSSTTFTVYPPIKQ